MGFFKKDKDKDAPQPAAAAETALVPLSNEAIITVRKARENSYAVDNSGDVFGSWGEEGHRLWFLRSGQDKEILNVRYVHATLFDAGLLHALYEFCNAWNDNKLFPKAYVRVKESGRISLIGELTIDLEHGVTPQQLDLFMRCGITTGLRMGESADEKFGGGAPVEKFGGAAPDETPGVVH